MRNFENVYRYENSCQQMYNNMAHLESTVKTKKPDLPSTQDPMSLQDIDAKTEALDDHETRGTVPGMRFM